jgi:anti-sigma regulatory factor (Ser/Thr protein kinase)
MPHVVTELKSDPASVKAARDFVAAALKVWDVADLSDVAVLLTSELVTNAVIHARTAIRLCASYAQPELLVEVSDGSATVADVTESGPFSTSGRGLSLVQALATRWGVRVEDVGKTVWFMVATRVMSASP